MSQTATVPWNGPAPMLATQETVEENLSSMAPGYYDPVTGCMRLSMHSWLLDTGKHKVLIPRPRAPVQSAATRRQMLEQACDRHALLLPGHFMPPHAGYVDPPAGGTAEGFRLDFIPDATG